MLEVLAKEEDSSQIHWELNLYKRSKNVNTTDSSFKAHEWQMVIRLITINHYKSKVINFNNDKMFEDQKAIKQFLITNGYKIKTHKYIF
jgi:hypothetical protein